MTRFFDTSALAKRYISESGSQLVRTTLRAHSQRDAIMTRLAGDFARLNIVEIRAALVSLVPDLVLRHPLRGYDAVQLATALTIRASGQSVEFWSADATLCQAAATEGLRIVNPS